MNDPAKFWAKADRSGGTDACWPWLGVITKYGYGFFHPVRGQHIHAHRRAYELAVGPIPDGLTLDHLCHEPQTCNGGTTCPHRRCVNPRHLSPVGRGDNARRSVRPSPKTHCPAGHPYTEANSMWETKAQGRYRKCRVCHRTRQRERYQRLSAAVARNAMAHSSTSVGRSTAQTNAVAQEGW